MNSKVDITPEAVDTAARHFATGQQDLIKAYETLSQKLQKDSDGMAGFDKAAHQFAAFYGPAAQAAFHAFHTAIEALGGTSLGLTHTINNYLAADHHSRADNPGGQSIKFPVHSVTQNFAVAAAPPSAVGPVSWAPNTTLPLLRPVVQHLPHWVEELIGTSSDWPQGNPHLFDETGEDWNEAARQVREVASWLNWTVTTILDPADSEEYAAVAQYWATLYRPSDPSKVISGLAAMCDALANACHEYARATSEAIDIALGEHIGEIIVLLAADEAANFLRGLVDRLLAGAGAFMFRAVTDISARWAFRKITADLLKAAADTKIVKAVQAVFDKTVGKKLQAALGRGGKSLVELFLNGPPKASDLEKYAQEQGWTRSKTPDGPIKYTDGNGIVRLTIKKGSPRAPGSGNPHVEIRNSDGGRTDPYGNPVTRKSTGNHTPIIWDLG